MNNFTECRLMWLRAKRALAAEDYAGEDLRRVIEEIDREIITLETPSPAEGKGVE